MRDAFARATKDPDYVAEARKLDMDNSPVSHVEVEQLLRRAAATPAPVIEEFDRLVNRK